jgi:hypothetical protein
MKPYRIIVSYFDSCLRRMASTKRNFSKQTSKDALIRKYFLNTLILILFKGKLQCLLPPKSLSLNFVFFSSDTKLLWNASQWEELMSSRNVQFSDRAISQIVRVERRKKNRFALEKKRRRRCSSFIDEKKLQRPCCFPDCEQRF